MGLMCKTKETIIRVFDATLTAKRLVVQKIALRTALTILMIAVKVG